MLTDQLRHWSHGRQTHRKAITASSGEKQGRKIPRKTLCSDQLSFLISFIRHTAPMVIMVTTGHQVYRQAISASSGLNELGKKILRNLVL